MIDHPCSVDGCPKEAARGGLCWGHVKKRQRGQTVNEALTERPESKIDVLREAALAYAEAEEDDDFRRAEDSLRKAAERFGAETARRAEAMIRSERARRAGLARAAKLTPERRKEIARQGAQKRWGTS